MSEEVNYEWKREIKRIVCRDVPCQGTLQTVNIHGHEQCVCAIVLWTIVAKAHN